LYKQNSINKQQYLIVNIFASSSMGLVGIINGNHTAIKAFWSLWKGRYLLTDVRKSIKLALNNKYKINIYIPYLYGK